MSEKSESIMKNIKALNLAEFSPTFFSIVCIFNDLIKIRQKLEKKFNVKKDIVKDTTMAKIEVSPEICPFCGVEGELGIDGAEMVYDGNYFEIPAICKCGRKSIVIYHIQFEQTEGKN